MSSFVGKSLNIMGHSYRKLLAMTPEVVFYADMVMAMRMAYGFIMGKLSLTGCHDNAVVVDMMYGYPANIYIISTTLHL
jgi:hypothetical protein